MKKLWAEILKRKKSSFVILLSGLLASTFAIIEITSDLGSILNPDKSSQVASSVEGGSISDLINTSRGLAQECSYSGLWLRNASGAPVEISESRWLTEAPEGDTEFRFRCLNMSLETEFSITNLALTNPGTIQIAGYVPKGFASKISVSVVSQDKDQSWCGNETISFDLKKDEDNLVRFEGAQILHDADRKECRFVYPASFVSVQQESNLQESTNISKKIDALLVGATPENCAYIGATVMDSSNLPNGEDRDFADYINSNFVSDEIFAISSPGADDYKFDPSLGFKLQYYPKWVWICRGSGVDYSEVHLGGYEWADGKVTKPAKTSFAAFYNPWTKSEVTATAIIETFDKSLRSCGVFEVDLSPSTDVDGWQRFNDMVDPGKNFDSSRCRIFSLKKINLQG